MRLIGLTLMLILVGVALVCFGGQIGWWWVTTLVGVVIGIVLRPARLALAISFLVGGLGWGLPLALLALNAPVAKLASAVEDVVGLPATGGQLMLLITVLLGCMLCIGGSWVGIAGLRLLPVKSLLPGSEARAAQRVE